MTEFEFQIIALIFVAFIIGVVIGYVLRTRVMPPVEQAADHKGLTLESRQKRPANKLVRGATASGSHEVEKSRSRSKAEKPVEDAEPKRDHKPERARKTGPASDNLQQIKGIGAVLEKKLNAMGIERFDQIAEWTESHIAEVDEQLNFRGRIQREKWVEQARDLAKHNDG